MTEFRPSRFEILPLVIKNLLIINVLFFLAEKTIGESGMFNMMDLFALHHVKSPLFKPWQLVTYMFMHANFWHIFGNMFALWMFGAVLETVWGPKRFLTFYFLCGIGGALIYLAFLWYSYHGLLNDYVALKLHPTPDGVLNFHNLYGAFNDSQGATVGQNYLDDPGNSLYVQQVVNYISEFTFYKISNPALGASGAVFGVLAAFVYLFPNTYIYLYFFVPIKAKWMGLFYFGYELVMAIQNNPEDNVARWAHVGGGLVGFLLVLTWNKKDRSTFY